MKASHSLQPAIHRLTKPGAFFLQTDHPPTWFCRNLCSNQPCYDLPSIGFMSHIIQEKYVSFRNTPRLHIILLCNFSPIGGECWLCFDTATNHRLFSFRIIVYLHFIFEACKILYLLQSIYKIPIFFIVRN